MLKAVDFYLFRKK